jgi:hypothetical protein
MCAQKIRASGAGGQTIGSGPAAAGLPGEAGQPPAAVPCQTVTIACEENANEEKPPLPGTKKKQAEALVRNVGWLAESFGPDRIGFVTFTVGDFDMGGKFRNLRDRKEAQRRFHSFLTNELCRRYQCGVVVTERHRNGGIHFHLSVVVAEDIRGNIDFDACFPGKDPFGQPVRKPDYRTANAALKREWAYLRKICGRYGFGRHQLQPMRQSGEALGCYLGKYLAKDWEHRLPEDRGARCIRYFGHWSKAARMDGQRREARPHGNLFGWTKARARAWREMVKQAVTVLTYKGTKITEDNIKEILGPRWAWKAARLFRAVRFVLGDWQDAEMRLAINEHNQEVRRRWLEGGGDPARDCWWDITEITLDHLRPSPEWTRQMNELQLAKEVEAEIKRRLRAREAQERTRRRVGGRGSRFVRTAPPELWATWIERTANAD